MGIPAMIQPLVVTAIPTAAYAAYTRALPPQFLRVSLYGCVLLHIFDRVWHPKGMMTENMPTTHMNRRVF